MLTLVLAEAELEVIPQELCAHPAILSYAHQRNKNPTRLLLDSNYHHRAMADLPDGRRRGRPDIVHLFLLTALESVVNKQGHLHILIHTRNNDLITVNPETRIMRNYERFVGLMEQLFEHHVVPNKKQPLLTLQRPLTLQQVVDDATADYVMVCSQTGAPTQLPHYFHEIKKRQPHHLLCIIGGFPSGTFHTDLNAITNNVISIYKDMLSVWTVASEILINYEVLAL